jgi:hypothetical protein
MKNPAANRNLWTVLRNGHPASADTAEYHSAIGAGPYDPVKIEYSIFAV